MQHREPKGCLYSDTLHTRPHVKTRREISSRRTTGEHGFPRFFTPLYVFVSSFISAFSKSCAWFDIRKKDSVSLGRFLSESERKKKEKRKQRRPLKGLFAVYAIEREHSVCDRRILCVIWWREIRVVLLCTRDTASPVRHAAHLRCINTLHTTGNTSRRRTEKKKKKRRKRDKMPLIETFSLNAG